MADGQALKSQCRQQESPVRKRGVFLLRRLGDDMLQRLADARERTRRLPHCQIEISGAVGCATRPPAWKNPVAPRAGFFFLLTMSSQNSTLNFFSAGASN
jgi:hypothetical protein